MSDMHQDIRRIAWKSVKVAELEMGKDVPDDLLEQKARELFTLGETELDRRLAKYSKKVKQLTDKRCKGKKG